MSVTRTLARFFPTPRLLSPHAAGIDITDASIKWVTLAPHKDDVHVVALGQQPLPAGIVENGAVKDAHALAENLINVKKRLGGVTHAHAALPEEGAYVFSMSVPEGSSHEEIIHMIEFELEGRVPIQVSDLVFDYDVVSHSREAAGTEIGVVAFARDIAEGYVAAFDGAGIELLSLEIEARSIARAILGSSDHESIVLLVDAGKARTGFAILKQGVPIFTSTVDIGGVQMTDAVVKALSFSEEQAEIFKNEQGLFVTDSKFAKGSEALEKVAAALAEEVARHYHFWDTRRNEHGERVTPVERILLVGGSANLKGLPDYVAQKVHAPTERPNVWRNVCSFDEYIPPIDRRTSLQFATAIGLALRNIGL